MADGAMVAVSMSARHERLFIGLDGRIFHHLPVNACIERNAGDEALVGEWRVVHRHRNPPELEIKEHYQRNENDSKHKPEQNTTHLNWPP
jgi:hypothetical protein